LGSVATTFVVLIGFCVGWLSAALWHRFRLLRPAPFVYAFVVYLIEVTLGTLPVSRWDMPVVLGSLYYGAGWLEIGCQRLNAMLAKRRGA
jgi:hypothetical protein